MNSDGEPFIPKTKKEADALAKLKDIQFLHEQQIPKGLTLAEMEGACLGTEGEVQLSYYDIQNPKSEITIPWKAVDPNKNFTTQWRLKSLKAGTNYRLILSSKRAGSKTIGHKIMGAFKTPPEKAQVENVSFGVVSCHDYNRRDTIGGHKIYSSMEADKVDFMVHTGDIEYYDKINPWAMTEDLMYFKWDRLFALPIQRSFYQNTTCYFMKDDHDTLKDDAYPGDTYGPVSFERGLEIFDREQFPSADKTYKTIRWGKDLQVWILEGRNYRSKNTDPDGPNKTILGKVQKEWMYRTLKESDATFKVIITSSPILGPDRPKGKNDNYSNRAFEYEGAQIRDFINEFDNVFICNGDRHWQYATHFEGTNLWEFGCGAGSDSHAGGWEQDNVQPEHKFLRVKGGYLYANVSRDSGAPKISFEHRDVDGNLMHQEQFSASK